MLLGIFVVVVVGIPSFVTLVFVGVVGIPSFVTLVLSVLLVSLLLLVFLLL